MRKLLLLALAALVAGVAFPPAGSSAAETPSDLPTVAVPQRPLHTVPEESAPAKPVIMKDRDARPAMPRAQPQAAARPLPPASPQLPALTISGMARVDQAVSLMVRGRNVPLFGVRAPQAGDRCAARAGVAPRACSEVAREALAARLAGNASVFCRVPRGQRDGATAAVCLDARGVDLGGFLIGEGFALADPRQSYEYSGAEGIAHSARRGLWRYR